MLTVRQLQSNDIKGLKNVKVCYSGGPFARSYLEKVLEFKLSNLIEINSEHKYLVEFESNNISAAFLEIPYEKVFLNKYGKGYTSTVLNTHRFGGFGFVSINLNITGKLLRISSK